MTLYQKYYGRVFKQSGQWKISVQHNGVRKTFYSSLEGDMGRKDCAKKVVAWISAGAAPTSNNGKTLAQKTQRRLFSLSKFQISTNPRNAQRRCNSSSWVC